MRFPDGRHLKPIPDAPAGLAFCENRIRPADSPPVRDFRPLSSESPPKDHIARHNRRRCLSLLPSVLYRFPASVEAQAVSGLARFSRTTPIARRWRNKAEAVYIANGPSTAISAEPLPPLTDDLPSTYSLFSSFSVFYPSPVPPVRFTPLSFYGLLILPRTRCSSCFRFSLLLGIPFYVMHIIYTVFSIYSLYSFHWVIKNTFFYLKKNFNVIIVFSRTA